MGDSYNLKINFHTMCDETIFLHICGSEADTCNVPVGQKCSHLLGVCM